MATYFETCAPCSLFSFECWLHLCDPTWDGPQRCPVAPQGCWLKDKLTHEYWSKTQVWWGTVTPPLDMGPGWRMKLRGSYKLSTKNKHQELACGAAVTAEGAASSWCEKGKLVLLRMMCLEPTNNADFVSEMLNGSYKTNLAYIKKTKKENVLC